MTNRIHGRRAFDVGSFRNQVRQIFCILRLGPNSTVTTVAVITVTSRVGKCRHVSSLQLRARVISTFMVQIVSVLLLAAVVMYIESSMFKFLHFVVMNVPIPT